jgi:hypothetical protein
MKGQVLAAPRQEGGIKRVSRPSVKAREGKKVPDTSQQRSNKYRTNKLAAQVAQREDDLCHPARGGVMSPQQVTAGVSPTAGTSTALPRPVTCPVVEAAGAPAATTNLVLLASGDEMSSEEYVSPVKKIWNGRDACRLILASLEERMDQRWQPLGDGRWGRVVGREGTERSVGRSHVWKESGLLNWGRAE